MKRIDPRLIARRWHERSGRMNCPACGKAIVLDKGGGVLNDQIVASCVKCWFVQTLPLSDVPDLLKPESKRPQRQGYRSHGRVRRLYPSPAHTKHVHKARQTSGGWRRKAKA